MTDLGGKTVMVVDQGSFVEVAVRLARDFGRVLYFMPWESDFPRLMDVAVGEGVPGVDRVYNFWDHVDEVDLFVFPDCGMGDLQQFLRSLGYRVWGTGGADWIELDRWAAREHQRRLGLPTPRTQRVVGLDSLRDLVKSTEDKWIKTSTFRGDFETFHHEKPFTSGPFLDVLQGKYGPQAPAVEFIVEDSVPGVEIGWDCHCVDGLYPDLGLLGLEVKDRALVGALVPFAGLPDGFNRLYNAFSPALADGQFRNYLTFESRTTPGSEPVMIDPCCRFGSPASEAWMEMAGNFSEIVWEGAAGNLVQIDPTFLYAALVVINSPWAVKHWTPVEIPDESRRWVKLKKLTVIGGHPYYVPGRSEMSEIGVVVGLGDTLDEAVEAVKTHAAGVRGYSVDVQTDALDDALAAVEEAESVGVSLATTAVRR